MTTCLHDVLLLPHHPWCWQAFVFNYPPDGMAAPARRVVLASHFGWRMLGCKGNEGGGGPDQGGGAPGEGAGGGGAPDKAAGKGWGGTRPGAREGRDSGNESHRRAQSSQSPRPRPACIAHLPPLIGMPSPTMMRTPVPDSRFDPAASHHHHHNHHHNPLLKGAEAGDVSMSPHMSLVARHVTHHVTKATRWSTDTPSQCNMSTNNNKLPHWLWLLIQQQ